MKKINVKFSKEIFENQILLLYIKEMMFNLHGEFDIVNDDFDYFVSLNSGLLNIT